MYRWILSVVLFIGAFLGFGQSHGVPSGLDRMFMQGACFGDSLERIALFTGVFGSYAQQAFEGESKYEATLDFSDYVRFGTFVTIERKLYRNWNVGFSIPFLYSNVSRNTAWYPSGNYSISGITEIKLRIGYSKFFSNWLFFGGISTDLPLQKGRQAFASPAIYIGNDAFWSCGTDLGIVRKFSPRFKGYSFVNVTLNVPKNGSLVEGTQAMIISSDSVQSIQAQIAMRSRGAYNLGFTLQGNFLSYSLGYELYAETSDMIKQILPQGYLEQTATLESMKGKAAWSHNINAGISKDFSGIRLGLLTKFAVAGHGTFNEKIVLLMAGFYL
jgi:hypothetical protein